MDNYYVLSLHKANLKTLSSKVISFRLLWTNAVWVFLNIHVQRCFLILLANWQRIVPTKYVSDSTMSHIFTKHGISECYQFLARKLKRSQQMIKRRSGSSW